MSDKYFKEFPEQALKQELPQKFTFPFAYEPHPLSELAAKDLQGQISEVYSDKEFAGKMYGVLVVKDPKGKIGFLSAFSGQEQSFGQNIDFVPPIHDRLKPGDFFKRGEQALVDINKKILKLEKLPEYLKLQREYQKMKSKAAKEIEVEREKKNELKADRKKKREQAESALSGEAFKKKKKELDQESIDTHYDYKKLNEAWNRELGKIQSKLSQFDNKINALKKARKKKSNDLQQKLFDQYQFLNAEGKRKSLVSIFEPLGPPPAGAGDCAAPKLLQYAFANNYQPLALAEFWWGKTPKSQLRKEGRYYPACAGKCKPILGHMLKGLNVEPDPMLNYDPDDKKIDVLFEDDQILVINKPAGLLSIPSKLISDAVAPRMQKLFPKASGPLVAHRLDKLTSGLMIITKSLEMYREVQQQFIQKTVEKKYVALLEGEIENEKGMISLPLIVDEFNRPMQMVSLEKGKRSVTEYQVINKKNGRTLIQFKPITGRTHQLRVHAAHKDGLNAPIVGDTLYGKKDKRLMLHAAQISFDHPLTKERLTFSQEAEFA